MVAALRGDEATVKRLSIREHEIELRPENPRLNPIPIGPDDDLRIVGKVVAVRAQVRNERNSLKVPRLTAQSVVCGGWF